MVSTKTLWNYFLFSTLGILYMVSVTLLSKFLLSPPTYGFFYRNGLTDRYTLGFTFSTKIIWCKLAEVMHENHLSLFLQKLDLKIRTWKFEFPLCKFKILLLYLSPQYLNVNWVFIISFSHDSEYRSCVTLSTGGFFLAICFMPPEGMNLYNLDSSWMLKLQGKKSYFWKETKQRNLYGDKEIALMLQMQIGFRKDAPFLKLIAKSSLRGYRGLQSSVYFL